MNSTVDVLRVDTRQVSTEKYLQPNHDFECIINTPLGTSEGTNHHNTQWEPTRKETHQTDFLHSLSKEEAHENPRLACIPNQKTINKQKLTSPTVAPLALLRKETRLSAGWETIAQNTPAM
jgi:hypothetical protein